MTKSKVLMLQPSDIVARGGHCDVYAHPLDRNRLIKVMKSPEDLQRTQSVRRRVKTWLPGMRSRQTRKQYIEYLNVMLDHPGPVFDLPITQMLGFVRTGFGLGYVTEKVMRSDGQLGETLQDLLATDRLGQTHLDLLNDAISRIHALGIRVGDLGARNFVFGRRDDGSGVGARECVLVDGYGDIRIIPVRAVSRWLNRRELDKRCKKLARRTGLRWNGTDRRFSFAPAGGAKDAA